MTACTRCGECCRQIPCGLSQQFLGKLACPALEVVDGLHSCGLVTHPSRYIDLGPAAAWKDEVLGSIFATLLGIGTFCCSCPESEFTKARMVYLLQTMKGPRP
jgi:hypothetical protein